MIVPTTLIVTPASDIPCQRLEQLLPGLETSVVFRFRYTPPYETFHGIRRIQLLMQRTAAHEVQPALAVDVSEWADHASEEYFDVTLRFLADHPGYHSLFLMERTSERRMQTMKEALDILLEVCSAMKNKGYAPYWRAAERPASVKLQQTAK